MSSAFKTVLLAGACALGLAGAAFASGGGGGGSSSMPSNGGVPSASAPAYDPAAEYAKAIAALKAGQYKDAARAAQHVADAMPKSPDGWKILGAAQAGANDWKGSRKAYEKGVHLAPDDVGMHAGLALALANLKDAKAQSELDWLKAKIAACGDACPEGARMKAAAEEIQNVMTPAAPKPSASLSGSMLFGGPKAGDAAYVQAVGLINMHRYDEALAELAKARDAFGPHPDILTYQGYASRKKGELDQAERYYKEALQAAPDHVGATEYYGELKVERGDIAGARRLLAKLDGVCTFGCAEAEELRHWIDLGHDPQGR